MTPERTPITDVAKALAIAKQRELDLKRAAKFDRERFEERMLAQIVGQDDIVHAIGDVLQSGLAQKKRGPINLLLVGKAGLGKTTFARAMADAVFPGSKLLEFNFAQYKTIHQFQPAFFGGAGLWKGSAKGMLSEALISDPQRVIFFDEIDKADNDVRDMMLGPMEGGYRDEKLQREINLSQSILVFAGNWAHDALEELIANEKDPGERARKILEKLEEVGVAPWLLSRFKGGIYVMRSPDERAFLTIAEHQLEDLAASYGLELRHWSPLTAGKTVAEIWKRRDQGVRAVETVINLEGYAHLFREIQQQVESDPDDSATWVAIRIDDDGDDGFVIGPFEETPSEEAEDDSEPAHAED